MTWTFRFNSNEPAFEIVLSKRAWRAFNARPQPQSDQVAVHLEHHTLWEAVPTRVGFGGCGVVAEAQREVRITFPLSLECRRHVALTIHRFLRHINSLHNPEHSFFTLWDLMSGVVSGKFRRRMKRLTEEDLGAVRENMRCAFKAVVKKSWAAYADDCLVIIDAKSERFVLHCFGNACDIAIYPDMAMPPGYRCHFSSHNLDSVDQELTLLAGFLTLAERLQEKRQAPR